MDKKLKLPKSIRLLLLTGIMTIMFTISAFAETIYLNASGQKVEASSQLISTTITLKDGVITNVSPAPDGTKNYGEYTDKVNQYIQNKNNGGPTDGNLAGSGSNIDQTLEESEEEAVKKVPLYNVLLQEIDTLYGSNLIDVANSTSTHITKDNVTNPLVLLNATFDTVNPIIDAYSQSKIFMALTAIACTFIVIFFCVDITSKDVPQNFGNNGDFFFFIKPFAKLVIAIVVLLFVPKIIKGILLLSQYTFSTALSSMKDMVSSNTSATIISSEEMCFQIVKGLGIKITKPNPLDTIGAFFQMIGVVISFMFPWIIAILANMALLWTVLSRMFAIILHSILAPLAFTDLYTDRAFTDTRAFGYCREFIGICFQSLVILLTFAVSQSIISTLTSYLLDGFTVSTFDLKVLSQFAVFLSATKVAQATTVMGSAALAKKLFGAS